ncbi:DUF61 family protein [Chloroflexota bacterium]
MVDESPYEPHERILQESLKDELRVLNAFLPRKRKALSDLLHEKYPHIVCSDGSIHLFKKKELNYLAGLVDVDEQNSLLLPILIEVSSDDKMAIICRTEVEEKVISKVLDMPVTSRQKKIPIYSRQMSLLRKLLKTTTQYIFSARTNN